MTALLRLPHGFLRRYLSVFERVIVVGALAGLLYALMRGLPVYPTYWDYVITGVVFCVGLWSPAVAYFLTVLAAIFPLYSLSLYVAVLFLAVAMIGQRVFIHNLGATLLTLAAPYLAPFYLVWIIPLLGGLWWGAVGGAVMGGLAALWGQIIAGMSGLSPDWLLLLGSAPNLPGLAARFGGANSLQTLQFILEPLAPTSTILLYHLLQVGAWALVGGLVGALAERSWMQRRRPLGPMMAGTVGALALLVIHIALGLWLEQHTQQGLARLWLPLASAAVYAALLVSILEAGRDFVEHPLPPARRKAQKTSPLEEKIAQERAPLPIPTELPAQEKKKERDDLIMLELD